MVAGAIRDATAAKRLPDQALPIRWQRRRVKERRLRPACRDWLTPTGSAPYSESRASRRSGRMTEVARETTFDSLVVDGFILFV